VHTTSVNHPHGYLSVDVTANHMSSRSSALSPAGLSRDLVRCTVRAIRYDCLKVLTFAHQNRRAHSAAQTQAVVAADSRLVVYDAVPQANKIWIKGKHFSLENLLAGDRIAETWDNAAIATFKLSPQDYHRYHCPVTGKVKWWKRIHGDHYPVDPLCLTSGVDISTTNTRCAVCIESKEFGDVLFVAIGAIGIGSVM
jgi:phosphatidylserine decarboxylase precursor